jgi:hypothetical protein
MAISTSRGAGPALAFSSTIACLASFLSRAFLVPLLQSQLFFAFVPGSRRHFSKDNVGDAVDSLVVALLVLSMAAPNLSLSTSTSRDSFSSARAFISFCLVSN